MSVFANDDTNPRVNALLDPLATISYTGILSEQYFEIIKKIFSKFMYPGMVSIPVNYNGKEEIINMPGKIMVSNRIFYNTKSKHFTPPDFPFTFANSEKQHVFCFGIDIMQFKESEDVYVLSFYRNGIISFCIVLINNGCVYVVNINDNDDEIQYYKLDSETKNRIQEYISSLYCYGNLLDIFKNANIIGRHKEKIKDTSFVDLVKKVIDECISSPSQITSKLSEGYLASEPLTTEYIFKLPELKVEPIPNKLRDNSIKTGELIKNVNDVGRYRENLKDYEEFFVFIPPKVTGELTDFLWWYAQIEKTKDGNYQVSYYYYDAETVAALEHLCSHHFHYMNFLKLNEAMHAGIIPYYITTRWFKTLDEAQADVASYYNNPESIKNTNGYKPTLIRSITKIREASRNN